MFLGTADATCYDPNAPGYDPLQPDCYGAGSCNYPLVWDSASQSCQSVLTGGDGGPQPIATFPITYVILGVAALVLLSFAGGRVSKRSSSGSKMYSRTTTRTLFA